MLYRNNQHLPFDCIKDSDFSSMSCMDVFLSSSVFSTIGCVWNSCITVFSETPEIAAQWKENEPQLQEKESPLKSKGKRTNFLVLGINSKLKDMTRWTAASAYCVFIHRFRWEPTKRRTMHQNQWKVKTRRKLYRRCFTVTHSGARKTKINKSNLKMSTDLLIIKYHRLRRFCIMNKANESKLTVTKVMISTTLIQ